MNIFVPKGKIRIQNPLLLRGDIPANPAGFGPILNVTGLTGTIVMGIPSLGCSPFANSKVVANNIVLIRRGECMFSEKVKMAQKAGALAAIISDTSDQTSFITMSGDGTEISIPSLLISKSDAEKIQYYLPSLKDAVQASLFAQEPYQTQQELMKTFSTTQLQDGTFVITVPSEQMAEFLFKQLNSQGIVTDNRFVGSLSSFLSQSDQNKIPKTEKEEELEVLQFDETDRIEIHDFP